MALSDLTVYSEYAYNTMQEMLAYNMELFNAASQGTLVLTSGSIQGDFSERSFWNRISGLVKRRDVYGSGSLASKKLTMNQDVKVKLAAGTPPIEINPHELQWIQKNPAEAGVIIGRQLAEDSMADMVTTALTCTKAALVNVGGDVIYDATSDSPDTLTNNALVKGAAKFGDRSGDIRCWIVHSTPMHDFYANALDNSHTLFTYGTVNVIADPFGRTFIVSDSAPLITAGTPNIFWILGLTQGAVTVEGPNDYLDNINTTNGDENILRTYQAQWTYNIGVKGFSWDTTNGGKCPTDAALATGTNWDKYVTSIKDVAGVIVKVN